MDSAMADWLRQWHAWLRSTPFSTWACNYRNNHNAACRASSAPGLWYTAEGLGGAMSASLCGSTYDTKLSVYTGECGAVTCLQGNDDSCGLQSVVDGVGETGVTYYILVHGFSSNSGNFTLNVTAEAADCISLTSVNADHVAGTIAVTWDSPAPGGEFEVSVDGEVAATTGDRRGLGDGRLLRCGRANGTVVAADHEGGNAAQGR